MKGHRESDLGCGLLFGVETLAYWLVVANSVGCGVVSCKLKTVASEETKLQPSFSEIWVYKWPGFTAWQQKGNRVETA